MKKLIICFVVLLMSSFFLLPTEKSLEIDVNKLVGKVIKITGAQIDYFQNEYGVKDYTNKPNRTSIGIVAGYGDKILERETKTIKVKSLKNGKIDEYYMEFPFPPKQIEILFNNDNQIKNDETIKEVYFNSIQNKQEIIDSLNLIEEENIKRDQEIKERDATMKEMKERYAATFASSNTVGSQSFSSPESHFTLKVNKFTTNSGYYEVIGEIKNIDSVPFQFVSLKAEFLNKAGEIVGEDTTFACSTDYILPNGTKSFKFMGSNQPDYKSVRCHVVDCTEVK